MKIPFLDLKKINEPYRELLKKVSCDVINSGLFIRNSKCLEFETAFANYCNVPYAVSVGNGFDALTLMLRSEIILKRLNIGDEILVPSNTYIATILAISAAGLKPKLVEPDINSFNIDPKKIDLVYNKNVKGIMVVHLYGRLCDMSAINLIAKKYGLLVFEDAAQAHGAYTLINQKKIFAGSFGEASAYSFYPTKNLGALGDGGLVLTKNKELAQIVRMLSNYGEETKYVNKFQGVNSRLDEIQAAILLKKLPYLSTWNKRRQIIASRYINEIKNQLIILPQMPIDVNEHVWHVFTLRVKDEFSRNKLKDYLANHGIGTLLFYPIPPHLQEAYGESLGKLNDFPIAEKLAKTVISIPMNQMLSDDEVSEIIGVLNEFSC